MAKKLVPICDLCKVVQGDTVREYAITTSNGVWDIDMCPACREPILAAATDRIQKNTIADVSRMVAELDHS